MLYDWHSLLCLDTEHGQNQHPGELDTVDCVSSCFQKKKYGLTQVLFWAKAAGRPNSMAMIAPNMFQNWIGRSTVKKSGRGIDGCKM
jgi:hypothetical protein